MWGEHSNNELPFTLPIPTRREQEGRAAEGGMCVRDKARFDLEAQAKKSLAKKEADCAGPVQLPTRRLVCGMPAGHSPSRPWSPVKVGRSPVSEMSAADNDSGPAGWVF